MNQKIADFLSFEDLSDDMKLVAQTCGLEVARSLIANCPGIQVYVPRPENIPEVVRRFINARTGGRRLTDIEIKALAIELAKSPTYIRHLARGSEGLP